MVLDGGNSNIFYFHPDPWGNDPISLIFFKGLVQLPTSRRCISESKGAALHLSNDLPTLVGWDYIGDEILPRYIGIIS